MAKTTINKLEASFKLLSLAYKRDNFDVIINHDLGIYFLKLRSISRKDLLLKLAHIIKVNVVGIPAKKLFEHLYYENISGIQLDRFIKDEYILIRKERIGSEENLYTQLSRLSAFDWGGFYQNAVEVTIINNYVKKIQHYETIVNSVDVDLAPRLKKYVLCSWYNHWSTILIEAMFNNHNDITPAVGQIKKVDFFWKNFPFDLKVTYFPSEFMKIKRKERNLRPELTELKSFARRNLIHFDGRADENLVYQELITKISESVNSEAIEFMSYFNRTRQEIIEETIQNPSNLIKWFYENQGTRRFDAANRIYLVLIDIQRLDESWKLKRNKELLNSGIISFLDANKDIEFSDLRLDFDWDGEKYSSYATCIFILK